VSQTNRVVRHKTNARKNWTKPERTILVTWHGENDRFVTRVEAISMKEALKAQAKRFDGEAVIVGNVMTIDGYPGMFIATET
jgi:hypothetical protein